jgi:hypothetical protein
LYPLGRYPTAWDTLPAIFALATISNGNTFIPQTGAS